MAPLTVRIESEAGLDSIARGLVPLMRPGLLICLIGDLGAGKTALARTIIRAATSPDEEVPSPTFTLVQSYDTPTCPIHHFDLYRLADATEIEELGWDDLKSDGMVLVEWPDRLGPFLPLDRVEITLETDPNDPDARSLHINLKGDTDQWTTHLASALGLRV